MAYIDFTVPPAAAATTDAPRAGAKPARPVSTRRLATPHATLWIALGIAGVIASLLFALAFVAIGESLTAGLVATLLLLPGASLFGGDGRRHS